MGCGYLPIGYLPTGYLPTGYLPIGAAATGGGSLRGKSAAAATLSMAMSPAVTIMIVFMMLIPLCCSPGRADRVTPLFLVCADARFYHPTFRLNRQGNGSRLFVALAMDWFKCDWEDREGRRLTKWSHASMVGSDGEVPVHCHHSFTVASSLRLSNYRRRVESAPPLPTELRRSDHHCRRVPVHSRRVRLRNSGLLLCIYKS